jgi:hypothetical protein
MRLSSAGWQKGNTMNASIKKFFFKSDYSRRFPDPLNQTNEEEVTNIEHFLLLCKAQDLPDNLPTDPNPREQNIDQGIYKDIAKSLENQDEPTFHLKNKGITILSRSVDQSDDKKHLAVLMGEGDGIVDGAHSYRIIRDCINRSTCPDNQYVKVEIITGVPRDMVKDIAGGLNTAVQVQKASLANLAKRFDWLQKLLKPEPYASQIAYKENEVDKEYDVRDIIGLLTLFNIGLYPNGEAFPKEAYTSKGACLDKYLANQESYEKLAPIVKDILELHDYVHMTSREKYNKEYKGRAAAMKGVFNTRKRGAFPMVFTNTETEVKLHDGALYPILGALRFLVEMGDDGLCKWKVKSLNAVKSLFNKIAPEMIKTTYNTSLTYGRKPNAVGKDDNLWRYLYKTAALACIEGAQASVVAKK